MEMVELKASVRSQTGKKGAREYRKRGLVPGILYGRNEQPAPVAVDPKELNRALHTHAGANAIIRLSVEDKADEPITVVVKELQVDTIKGTMTHVDFCHISLDEVIQTSVPFEIVGEAPGVKQGGILERTLWELEIESLPLNIPDSIKIDVSSLDLGDALMVSDLSIPEGITVLTDSDIAVVSIVAPRGEPAAEVAAAPAEAEEPEVISGKPAKEAEKAEETEEKKTEKRK
ncbi:MAG: 50S ribosomal protein L25 [Candidatus Abyssobacteria bacterium SURF_5]|uniref:Large ribosomal subunit protein bL25 n=1 Tax=Abyssobacteria bacterium (strain SURF_5) TaxID=2093360 RepID=A0A3A4P548_ABYX5|nr:MAG: 50S ribosomal protein L25 [Candidatus Abyssubacteria bacterium SURF_5]